MQTAEGRVTGHAAFRSFTGKKTAPSAYQRARKRPGARPQASLGPVPPPEVTAMTARYRNLLPALCLALTGAFCSCAGEAEAAPPSPLETNLATLCDAVETYATAHGEYPESLGDLLKPGADGNTALELERLPRDPWFRPFAYTPPMDGSPYQLASLGSDGAPGGEGEGADINLQSLREGRL